ncbi:MAG: hypothetical protein HZB68_02300 [Candidatus Aenigmarchaeota archaeon]|nr:hypothetical protein [Candidatus Aenigmarchaeota archaeon]
MNYEWLGVGGVLIAYAFILLAALRFVDGLLVSIVALFVIVIGTIKREGPGSYTEGGI